MKHYEQRTYTQTHDVCVKRTCDLCGKATKDGDNWQDASVYDVAETEVSVTVKCKEGENYPSGGHSDDIVVDMCPSCFTTKLVPWLQSQGVKVEAKRTDW
jgi:shikimate 5-dehydrogenase